MGNRGVTFYENHGEIREVIFTKTKGKWGVYIQQNEREIKALYLRGEKERLYSTKPRGK